MRCSVARSSTMHAQISLYVYIYRYMYFILQKHIACNIFAVLAIGKASSSLGVSLQSPSILSASSELQLPNEWQLPPWMQQVSMQQRQEQEGTQHHFTHGVFQDRQLNMFEQQQQTSRPQQPTSELSFAELPRHAAVLRQQLQRLKDEVALLQVPSHSTQI